LLVARGIGLVYGGASVGLMGALANSVMAAGGTVIGVIPQHLVEFEVAHGGLDELRVVGSMHERKIGLLNVGGFFNPLSAFLDSMVTERFLSADNRRLIALEAEAASLLDRLAQEQAPAGAKWLDRDRT